MQCAKFTICQRISPLQAELWANETQGIDNCIKGGGMGLISKTLSIMEKSSTFSYYYHSLKKEKRNWNMKGRQEDRKITDECKAHNMLLCSAQHFKSTYFVLTNWSNYFSDRKRPTYTGGTLKVVTEQHWTYTNQFSLLHQNKGPVYYQNVQHRILIMCPFRCKNHLVIMWGSTDLTEMAKQSSPLLLFLSRKLPSTPLDNSRASAAWRDKS